MTIIADTVIKIGGALLALPGAVDRVAQAFQGPRPVANRLLIVPGGGPFAAAVRAADSALHLDASAAHWMAVLGMGQYAHLLVSRLRDARLVEGLQELAALYRTGALPVLAPYHLLRAADPLPHSWDVTSDSIAAWVAQVTGATRLILVKPTPTSQLHPVVDGYFYRAVGDQPGVSIIEPDRLPAMLATL